MQNKTNSSKKTWFMGCVAIAALTLLFVGLNGLKAAGTSDSNANSSVPSQKGNENEVAVPVFATKVARGTVNGFIKTSGEILSMYDVQLNPEANGKIMELFVDVGDTVKKGAKLAQIDNKIQKAQYQEADSAVLVAEAAIKLQEVMVDNSKTRLTAAKAALQAAESALKNVSTTKARQEKLLNEGAISRQSVDDIIAAYDAASARYTGAESDLKLAQDAISTANTTLEMRKAELVRAKAARNSAKVLLDNTIVVAPFDGVITARYFDPGAMANVAAPMFRIEESNPVKIICSLPEKDLYSLDLKTTKPMIKVDALHSEFEGKIRRIYPSVDSVSRTGKVEILVPNTEAKLMSGMFADVRLVLETHKDVPVVHRDSILRYEGKTYVYVIDSGYAERQEVVTGIVDDNTIEIISGVNVGTQIIAKGIEFIRSGVKVSVSSGEEK